MKLRAILSYVDKYKHLIFAIIDGYCEDGKHDGAREALTTADIKISRGRSGSTFMVSPMEGIGEGDLKPFMGRQCEITVRVAQYKFYSKIYDVEIEGKRLVLEDIRLIKQTSILNN